TMANLLRDRGYDIPLLILINQSQLIPYVGDVAFFYSADGYLNPYRRFSSGLARYKEVYGERFSVDLIPGDHGLIHFSPYVQTLAEKLRTRLRMISSDFAVTITRN